MMFYIKTKLPDGKTVKTEVTDENVFTRCVECDAELQVDLVELASDEHFDLCGTGIYCSRCSCKRWNGAVRHGDQQV